MEYLNIEPTHENDPDFTLNDLIAKANMAIEKESGKIEQKLAEIKFRGRHLTVKVGDDILYKVSLRSLLKVVFEHHNMLELEAKNG